MKIRRTILFFIAPILLFGMVSCGSDGGSNTTTGNSAPVANAGPDQTVTTGAVVTLDGSGSTDANGDALTYSWSMTSKPVGSAAALSNTTAVNPTFTADMDGAYVISLTVNDGIDSSAPDTVTVTAFPIALAETGQTACYDATGGLISCTGTGQDGELQVGVAWPNPRFTTGTGATAECVTDNLTGLTWVKSPDGTLRTWQEALDYANALALCGSGDWRLPNVNELESLVNAGQADSAAWLNGVGFSNARSDTGYWSSTTDDFTPASAWSVYMGDGPVVDYDPKAATLYTWPVRGIGTGAVARMPMTGQTACYDATGGLISCTGTGQDGELQMGVAWPNPRFTAGTGATADCVTDNLTGLMWVKSPDGTFRTWQEALTHANGLTLCGYTDWRLPNRKEMRSLVDYSQNTVALPAGHLFTNVQADQYCTSTSYAFSPDQAWYFSMAFGDLFNSGKFSTVYVWPVREGQ